MTHSLARPWLPLLLCFAAALAAAQSIAGQTEPQLFEQLLDEAGLRFTPSPDFTDLPGEANPVLSYEHALRHRSGGLELRFIIRPLARISIDYNDPHNAAPEPNHLFPLLFESITTGLSGGGRSHDSEYPQSQAQELFNADWAAASVFDVDPEFSSTYRQALLIGIHRNGKADAYTVFLYNEYSAVRELIQGALATLSFTP